VGDSGAGTEGMGRGGGFGEASKGCVGGEEGGGGEGGGATAVGERTRMARDSDSRRRRDGCCGRAGCYRRGLSPAADGGSGPNSGRAKPNLVIPQLGALGEQQSR